MNITKTIDYYLSDNEYATIRGVLHNDKETLEMLNPATEEFKQTLCTFFPEKFPAGVKSNIEILIVRIPAVTSEPKVFCHLNIMEPNGFSFAKILRLEDIDQRTGKPKTYKNNLFKNNYEIRFH